MAKAAQFEKRDYFRVAAGGKRLRDGGPKYLAQVRNDDLNTALSHGDQTVPARLYMSEVRHPNDTVPIDGTVKVESVRTQVTAVYKDQFGDFLNLVRRLSIIGLWEFGLVVGGNHLLTNMLNSEGDPVKDSIRIPALMIAAACAFLIGRYMVTATHGQSQSMTLPLYITKLNRLL